MKNGLKDSETLDKDPATDPGSPPPNGRDATSALARKKAKRLDAVLRKIEDAKEKGLTRLDFSKQGLTAIPAELLDNAQLEYLYLEGNDLINLPENFFDCLPKLRWLDLRRNYLASLPHTYIGRHQNLQTLLLEGNELKTLPLELGLVTSMRGLNISNNPLEFPPPQVIEKGTHAVLTFMRDLLHAKSMGMLPSATQSEATTATEHLASDSCDSDEAYHQTAQQYRKYRFSSDASIISEGESLATDTKSDLVGPVPHSASLHKPVTYNELKSAKTEKLKKVGALGTIDRKSRRKKKVREVNRFPEPPSTERVELRFLEERKLAKLRHIKSKQDDVLQKRKEVKYLKEWRSDAQTQQQDKYREAYIYGGAKEPVDIAEKAPFGVDNDYMKLPTNEERIKMEVKQKHEQMRRPVSPETRLRQEEERAARDRELERRIKAHMLSMAERRRHPQGSPGEEMEAAKHDLQIAERLQQEIESRRKALEYRFTAFTGDNVGLMTRSTRSSH